MRCPMRWPSGIPLPRAAAEYLVVHVQHQDQDAAAGARNRHDQLELALSQFALQSNRVTYRARQRLAICSARLASFSDRAGKVIAFTVKSTTRTRPLGP